MSEYPKHSDDTPTSHRDIGNHAEDAACRYLQTQGVEIINRNFHSRRGEIDIVCRDGEYLVFVEVKYRAGTEYLGPLGAVSLSKQRRICAAADFYRVRYGIPPDTPVRYDVIGIQDRQIAWVKNAFEHIYRGH